MVKLHRDVQGLFPTQLGERFHPNYRYPTYLSESALLPEVSDKCFWECCKGEWWGNKAQERGSISLGFTSDSKVPPASPAHSTLLFHLKEEKTFFKCLWSSQHRLTKSLRPNSRIIEHLSSPLHFTTTLLKGVLFTWYIMSCYQEKTTRHSRRHKNRIRSGRANIGTRLGGMLELSGQQFKTNMINMLRTLVAKGDRIQEHKDNVSTEVEIFRKNQKPPKARNKTLYRNEDCLW